MRLSLIGTHQRCMTQPPGWDAHQLRRNLFVVIDASKERRFHRSHIAASQRAYAEQVWCLKVGRPISCAQFLSVMKCGQVIR